MEDGCDIAVVGAGAAGLKAAIWAGRAAREADKAVRIVALDGAGRLGAKILVAGGGRCNVTHDVVDERAFCGSSPHAIKKVLRSFGVERTREFFASIGVDLVRETTGKLFPSTNRASTVLAALLDEARRVGVEVRFPWRVATVSRDDGIGASDEAADGRGFVLEKEGQGEVYREGPRGTDAAPPGAGQSENQPQEQRRDAPLVPERLRAKRVILATGGMSLPKTGSDGGGYALACGLGHSITRRVFPALVPLVLGEDEAVRTLSGISSPATLEVRSPATAAGEGRVVARFTDSVLCTHFGLSGPAVLDASRHVTAAGGDGAPDERTGATLSINWLPGFTAESLDERLVSLSGKGGSAGGQSVARTLASMGFHVELEWLAGEFRLAERLARGICEWARVDPGTAVRDLTREARRRVARAACAMTPRVVGDRGFLFAEATAGGVPLEELRLETMESRACPGLHIAGEVCDVDGRIGGYNFQWAWSSGYLAGRGAAKSVVTTGQALAE